MNFDKLKKEEKVVILAIIFLIFMALLNVTLFSGIAIGAMATVLIYEFYLKADKNDSKRKV